MIVEKIVEARQVLMSEALSDWDAVALRKFESSLQHLAKSLGLLEPDK